MAERAGPTANGFDQETRVVAYHVGARGMGVALEYPQQFRGDVVDVLFEADPDCFADLDARKAPNQFVAPFCLGERDGNGVLRIMANPYFSSLRDPDPEFQNSSCEVLLSGEIDGVPVNGARYDARYGDENRVVRRLPVAVRAIDSLRRNGELPFAAPPDFLSVDTQGTDFEVLVGAHETIAESVLAIVAEIEFRPMYTDQALFSRIFDFAIENDFEFVGFTYLQETAPTTTSIGARARDFLSFGDALFFRRIDAIRRLAKDPDHLFVMMMKLAFIALSFHRLGHCLHLLDLAFAGGGTDELRMKLGDRYYFEFLRRLHETSHSLPVCGLYNSRQQLVNEMRSVRAERPKGFRRRNQLHSQPRFVPDQKIEAILLANGFEALAEVVRDRRAEADRYIPGAVGKPRRRIGARIERFAIAAYRRLNLGQQTGWRAHVVRAGRRLYRRLNP